MDNMEENSENMEETQVELWNDMENMEETQEE
jgi:hypothetical protein